MRFTSDFWIKKQDASDIKAGTSDGNWNGDGLKLEEILAFYQYHLLPEGTNHQF